MRKKEEKNIIEMIELSKKRRIEKRNVYFILGFFFFFLIFSFSNSFFVKAVIPLDSLNLLGSSINSLVSLNYPLNSLVSLNSFKNFKIIGLNNWIFYEGLVDLIFDSGRAIKIYNPKDITYNFSRGENYTINLNVTSNFEVDSWWYDLIDLRHNQEIYEDIFFEPNISFNAVRWENRLIVYANNSLEEIHNDSIEFFVFIPNSAPIITNLSENIYVCENQFLSYLFNVSDFDEDTLTSDISQKNPFYLSFYDYINLTDKQYEIFSGVINKENIGGVNNGFKIYQETISISDEEYSDSKNINITAIEVNNAPAISSITTKTIWNQGENNTLYHDFNFNDLEDGSESDENLNYTINFSNNEDLFNITSKGIINFTADNTTELGVYNISICVRDLGLTNPYQNISLCLPLGDSIPITSCEDFSLTITNENRNPNITDYYPINLSFSSSSTKNLYFNITKTDPDGTIPDGFWYVDDVEKEIDKGNSSDEFYYNFGCGVSGNHTIKAIISDGELNDSVQWNISLRSVACPVPPPDGGGGGGGGLSCIEKWGCEEWNNCQNLESLIFLNQIDYETQELIIERCSLFNWNKEQCGFQTRECNDFNYCKTNLSKPGIIRECYYSETPDCSDGIKNCHDGFCEILIDCGGPCPPCPSCSDKIKNQGEEGVDCGGPCAPCIKEIPMPLSVKKILIYISLLIFIFILIIIITLWIRYLSKRHLKKKIYKKLGD